MSKFMKTAIAIIAALSMAVPAMAAPVNETEPADMPEPAAAEAPAQTPLPDAEIIEAARPISSKQDKFSDITDDFAWARTYINAMAEKGLISGYEDGTFKPDNDVTRLEAISLFSRAMGSNEKANSEVLKIAHEKYDSIIENYGLYWGQDEVVYMMYKGALKKSDLDTYLKDQEKNTPMSRYEAAVIITKAMGGEDEALSDLGVVLDYTDAREVPSNAIQYVAYATDKGIMEGMGDGTFSPNTPVKRSQMAVMLSRTVDKTGCSFENVMINAVDTSSMTVTVTENNGGQKQYKYTGDTVFKSMGDDVQPKDIDTMVDAVITISGEKLTGVEALSTQPDRTVTGKYVSYASTSGKTTVRVTVDGTGETESFECDPNLSVIYDGSPATVRSFTRGDVIILELHNGKIVKITGDNKTVTISGAVVESIDVNDKVTITISHGDSQYNGQTYEISDDVTVRKNESNAYELDSIYKGDKVTLTLEYGVVTKIVATSSKKTVEGTIKSLTISSPDSTMTIKVKDEEITYTIPKDVQILINEAEGSLYDFRVGDAVRITVESDAITKIVATSTQESSGTMSGVVTAINNSYGVISIKPDGQEGYLQAYCKDDTTTFVTATGKTKKMKDIAVGQSLEIKGSISNGVFIGRLVVIISE